MRIYRVSQAIKNYYKNSVKYNNETSDDMVAKKLTRNIHLSKELNPILKIFKVYQYGNLFIITLGNTIVWLHNIKGYIEFDIDTSKKKELDKVLEIE